MRNIEKAEHALLFNEEPVFEELKDIVSADEVYRQKLEALHEFEALVWQGVDLGIIDPNDAEDALWDFIEYVEGDVN